MTPTCPKSILENLFSLHPVLKNALQTRQGNNSVVLSDQHVTVFFLNSDQEESSVSSKQTQTRGTFK